MPKFNPIPALVMGLITLLPFSNLHSQSLLWEITGNDLPGPSYLYGTMHVQDERVFDFPEATEPALQSCDAFAMELLMEEINPMEMMAMMVLDSVELKDLYSEEDYARLDAYFRDSLRSNLNNYKKIKPFFVYAEVAKADFGSEQELAVDLYFHKQAKEAGKKLIGLESIGEQMAAVNSIPLEDQAQMLLDAIEGGDSSAAMVSDSLLMAYLAGDFEKMQAISDASGDEMGPEFQSEFLDKRNDRMVERLLPEIQEQTTFIAVGALHLAGETGLINQLRKAGYTVTPK